MSKIEKTDLEKFIELYKSFGIECIVTDDELVDSEKFKTPVKIIKLSDGSYSTYHGCDTISKKFEGYTGFYSEITFTKEGKFLKQGFWE